MIVKVKHTKNGNVKITMSLEQAAILRSLLLEAGYRTTVKGRVGMEKEVINHLEDRMELAGIHY
jgi:hypothetical protein